MRTMGHHSAVVDVMISTSGNFEYELNTTNKVSPVGNGP